MFVNPVKTEWMSWLELGLLLQWHRVRILMRLDLRLMRETGFSCNPASRGTRCTRISGLRKVSVMLLNAWIKPALTLHWKHKLVIFFIFLENIVSFTYGVKSEPSGADFGHRESREGDITRGDYYVSLPDGRIQKVAYTVDEEGGYQAQVGQCQTWKPLIM
jgi:hypothetical protein